MRGTRPVTVVAVLAALAVTGAALGGGPVTPAGQIGSAVAPAITNPTPVAIWPVRGALADDRALLARAEHAWRAAPDPAHRRSRIRAVFADIAPPAVLRYAVVLTATRPGTDEATWVGFLTTDHTGTPDLGRLRLRAHGPLRPDAAGLGMLTAPDPADTQPPTPTGIAFALAAPTATVALRTAQVDQHLTEHDHGVGVLWAWPPPDHTAASTALQITTAEEQTRHAPMTAGLRDHQPLPLDPTAARAVDGHITVTGSAPGDILTVPGGGFIGVIDTDRRLITDLDTSSGDVAAELGITGTPLALSTDAHGAVHAHLPDSSHRSLRGQRVDLTVPGGPRLVLGHLTDAGGGWLITRVSPATAVTDPAVVLIRPTP